MNMYTRGKLGALVILSPFAWAVAACAQESGPASSNPMPETTNRFVVGAGVAVVLTYQGAGEHRTLPMPVIDVVSGPFYINLRSGIGVNIIDTKGFALGGGVALMPGYRRQDVPTGIDRLGVGAGARLFASVSAGGLTATLGGTNGFVGNTKGFIADASLSYPITISSRLLIMPSIAATWADARHSDGYFGITADEAKASGLRPFTGRHGFKDFSAAWSVSYRLNDRFGLTATGGAVSLVGNVANSPLVTDKVQPFGFLSLNYHVGP